MMTSTHEKGEFKKWFLYLDVLVIGIFALSLILLVRDAYAAGFLDSYQVQTTANVHYWNMLRDAAFIVGALSWFFYRYFKNSIKVLQNPWV